MKQKLLRALMAAALMMLAQATALGADEGTVSWTQAASVCYVSDAYYYTAGGQMAFVAGGLTGVPEGVEVCLTLRPRAREGVPCRLLGDAYMDFGDAREPLKPVGEVAADGSGVYSFTMRAGTAQLVARCAELYALDYAALSGLDEGQGTVSVRDAAGSPVTQAVAGEVVTLTVSPDATHALEPDSLAVVDETGAQVALEGGMGGVYTFAMPAGAVSISASFAPAAPVLLPSGVVGELRGEYAYADPPRALPGSELTLSVNPASPDERIRMGTRALESEGAPVVVKDESTDGETGAFTCTVTMPEGGLSVRAEVGALCRVTHDASVEVFAADMTTPVTTCCEGDQLCAVVELPDGYGLLDGLLSIESEGAAGQRRMESDDDSTVRISVTAPAGDMAISAALGQLYSIRNQQPQGLGVIQTYPAGSVPVGSTVTVALLPAEGWRVRADSLTITASGSHTEVARVEDGRFEMPACDCEISAVFEPVLYEVAAPTDGCFDIDASYTLSASGAVDLPTEGGVPAGALVRVTALPRADCAASGLYIAAQDGEPELIGEGAQAAFVMPDCDVSVYALCASESHALPQLAAGEADEPGKDTDAPEGEPGIIAGAVAAEAPGVPDARALPYGASVLTEERNLRLRAQSDTASAIVATYASGTHVTVEELGEDGEWARVTVDEDGKSGWMKAEYLVPDAAASDSQIVISVTLPEIRVPRPYLVEQEYANEKNGRVFKHILLL